MNPGGPAAKTEIDIGDGYGVMGHEATLREDENRAEPETYGAMGAALQAVSSHIIVTILLALMAVFLSARPAPAETIRLVALGDSLTAGYDLPADAAFPARLEAALRARGHDVEIANAGVSGDTAEAGLRRLDWSVPEDAHGVIVQLGANDMLRGLDPAATRAALDEIVARLTERGQEVLIAGMRAAPNMGEDYSQAFDTIYPELAESHDVLLYPFFLDGVAMESELNLDDGMHPNPDGVDHIVEAILPEVEALLARIAARR